MDKPTIFGKLGLLLTIASLTSPVPANARNLKVSWQRSSDTNVAGYVLHYGTSSQSYSVSTNAGNVTNLTLTGFAPGRTYFFAATAYDAVGVESGYSSELTHVVSPAIAGLSDLTLAANTPNQRADFTLEGGDMATGWTLGATSSNPTLIPVSAMSFGGASSNRYLLISPVSGLSGASILNVFVTDGIRTNRVTLTASVVGAPVNVTPTLGSLADVSVREDAGLQTIQLAGITSGSGQENQTLSVSAVSSNPSVVPNPSVTYSSPNANAILTFAPVANANGSAVITVTVNDHQATNNLFSRTFTVAVNSVNDAPTLATIPEVTLQENSGPQLISLSGITSGAANENQILNVAATSSDAAIIPNPTVLYTSPGLVGSLAIAPATNAFGDVTITVTVDDGQSTNATVTRSFVVHVTRMNRAPVVNIGTNTSTQPNVTFMVRARVTDDGLPENPGRTSAKWTKISGPGAVTIGNSNSALTTMKFSAQGMYRLRLSATDGELTSSNDFIVFVRVNTDMTPAVFHQVQVVDLTASSATLSWTNDELTTEQVEVTPEGGVAMNTLLNQALSLSHSVLVTNLQPETRYSLRARSRDASGNLSYSEPILITTLRASLVYVPLSPAEAEIVAPAFSALDSSTRSYISFPQAADGSGRFSFHLPMGGVYQIWARMRASSEESDSFATSIDGGAVVNFELATDTGNGWSDNWQWVMVRAARLIAGTHQLLIQGVEPNVAVGQLLVTNHRDLIPEDEISLDGTSSVADQLQSTYLVPLRQGWSMVGMPLVAGDSRITSLFPEPTLGLSFHKYDAAQGNYVTNVFGASGWTFPSMMLQAGEGGLLYNPGASFNWRVSGAVPEAVVSTANPGLNFLALTPAKSGSIAAILSSFTFKNGDRIHRLSPDDEGFTTYAFDGVNWDSLPPVSVGEAFFLELAP